MIKFKVKYEPKPNELYPDCQLLIYLWVNVQEIHSLIIYVM